ncbi:hypothetical protein BJ912DRAFT_276659 [Pholiota molesta]|nr:hypothetical protein BJ912DRAFT_276659 [Pholiota molesta]
MNLNTISTAMSNSDEDMEYEIQFDKMAAIFDNMFRSSAREPAHLSRDIFSVIQAHPTLACAHALAHSLIQTSHFEGNPKGIHTFVQGTAAVFKSYPEASEIIIDEPDATSGSGPVHFHDELYSGLEITPSNVTLQTSLLSASVVATGLMEDSSISMIFVREGLRLSNTAKDERHELLAIAACLQLVTAGAPMVKQGLDMGDSLDDVVQALENLKEDEVIQHPGGVRLLKATIMLAKNKFAESISPTESWSFLFADDVPPADFPSAGSSSNIGSLSNAASTPSIPKRQFHSISSASGSLSALPGTQHRPISSAANHLTTHYSPRSIRPSSGRHIPTNVRRHPHIFSSGKSSFCTGGAGIQERGFVKSLRFIL